MLLLFHGHQGNGVVAGVQNTPDAAGKTGEVDTTVTYTFTLVNTGNAGDIFTITKAGEAWTTAISDSSHSLEPAAETTFDVTVDVPVDAADDATDTVTITATSTNDPAVADSDELTTTANVTRSLTSVPDDATKSGDVATDVVYTFTLTNTGPQADTFTISKSGEAWTTVISDESIPLAAGANTTFDVTVSVPLLADTDDTDGVTITATSDGDPAVSDVDVLTTTATNGYLVYDLFTDTNEVTLPNHMPDKDFVGAGWIAGTGVWDVVSNKAVQHSGGGGVNNVYIDSGDADCTVEATVNLGTGAYVGFVVRATATNSNIEIYLASGDDKVYVTENNGGARTNFAAVALALSGNTSYKVTTILSGTSIKVYVDDGLIVDTTRNFNLSAGGHGFFTWDAIPSATWDGFTVAS